MFVESMFLAVEWEPFVNKLHHKYLIVGSEPVESSAMAEPIDRVADLGVPIKFGAKVRPHRC